MLVLRKEQRKRNMGKSMLIHDRRLSGNAPAMAQNIYKVDESVAIKHALGWISTYAKKVDGLDDLFVMCHGLESSPENAPGDSAEGYGLRLCREDLKLNNVDLTHELKGQVKRITLFACGPANTEKGREGTLGDGKRFCGSLALYTGATIIASSKTQTYNRLKTRLEILLGVPGADEIDFGDWEGPVFAFKPDGTVAPHKP
jgi:hypothetical protein